MLRLTNSLFLLLLLFACTNSDNTDQNQVASPELNLPERPNILWLVAEDLGPYLPSFGDSTVQTPNLSRLAAEGVCYDHVFSPSPVCAPSRAAIATGMYPTHIGANHMRTGPWYASNIPEEVVNNYGENMPKGINAYEAVPEAGVKMMSELLREAGYYCSNNAKQDYQFRATQTAWDESSREAHWRNRSEGQPFFSIFNFEVTHESRIWAKAEDSLWIDENLDIPIPPYLPDTEVGKKDVRRMYSNIKEMDHQVGEILKQLEEDGLLEQTIIFWYADHGGPLPRQKRLMYDSGLRVPMIIRFPQAQLGGSRDDQLVSFIDFAPTVFSLTGIEPPVHLDGKAFLGQYKAENPRKYIHAAADRFDGLYDTNRGVRDKQYKYIKYYEPEKPMLLQVKYREQMAIMQELHRLKASGELTEAQAQWFRETKPQEELFDVNNDPHELNNLANDPALKEKLEELRVECERWVNSFEDTGLMPETALLEKLWPEGKAPTIEMPTVETIENKLKLSCNTPGVSIGYKWITAEKPASWQIYQGPIMVQEGAKLQVIADRIGYKPSDVLETEVY